jgi:hypothetical protein
MAEVALTEVAAKLVRLAGTDWKYADLYLRDAERVISAVCSRDRFLQLRDRRKLVTTLAADLRVAVQGGDWPRAQQLAREGEEVRARVEAEHDLLSLAERIFGARSLDPDPLALALSGAVALPARESKRGIEQLCADLRALAQGDPSHQAFYELRAAELEGVVVDSPDRPPPRIDPSELREAALAAAEDANFAAVLRIAEGAARGRDRLGRVRAPRPASARVRRLAAPLPGTSVERARRLGLEPVHLGPSAALNAYLSCACADHPVLPAAPRTPESRALEACTCGHACPPGMGETLKASLDFLMVHPSLTSGGTRYLPWFGAETLLVETFPEDAPDARTPLLEALSLPGRLGLTRLAIEDALLSRGTQVCEDLALDPASHRLACIPFDAYQRLAPGFGWGRRRLWTHFDGYQLTRELHLQALVGGDVHFGGADDLCAVGRGYDSSHITTRFALLRRDRFEAREADRTEAGASTP